MGVGSLKRGFAITIDVGKTLAKLSLWSREGDLLEQVTRLNGPGSEAPWRTLDTQGVGDWLIEELKCFSGHPVEAIVPVAHGAAVAGIRDGALAFAPPDYEWDPSADVLAAYRAQRNPFAITGSPALPHGLNLGAQLHAIEALLPSGLENITLLPYAQYWAWLLSGVAVSEVSSLGCHSDLWDPAERDFSPLAKRRGWAQRFAPLASAGAAIGTLRPGLARATGLPASARVHAGLHDSNAALHAMRAFPELAGQEASVLSTGTWFITMRLAANGEPLPALPEGRDCLVNVDIHGASVPSARFMGGREIELLLEGEQGHRIDLPGDQALLLAAVPRVLAAGAMVLPTLVPGCGPFPAAAAHWVNRPDDPDERRTAIALYAALVADATLDLLDARGVLLVEGRFARADVFTRALAALRPAMQTCAVTSEADVSFGALMLALPRLAPPGRPDPVVPLVGDLAAYRAVWRAAVDHDQPRFNHPGQA